MTRWGDTVDATIDELGRDAAALTGYTSRVAAALVWLREAWTVADPDNRAGVVAAIGALLRTHSGRRNRARFCRILEIGLEPETAALLLDELDVEL